jgi:hypothetical protein
VEAALYRLGRGLGLGPGRRAHGGCKRAVGLELESGSATGTGSGMTGGPRLLAAARTGERR